MLYRFKFFSTTHTSWFLLSLIQDRPDTIDSQFFFFRLGTRYLEIFVSVVFHVKPKQKSRFASWISDAKGRGCIYNWNNFEAGSTKNKTTLYLLRQREGQARASQQTSCFLIILFPNRWFLFRSSNVRLTRFFFIYFLRWHADEIVDACLRFRRRSFTFLLRFGKRNVCLLIVS